MELHKGISEESVNLTIEQDLLSLGCGGGVSGDSNALILLSKKNNKKKECEKLKTKATPKLSKAQKKKLKKFEEEKEKALLLSKSLETLRTYAISENALSLLKSSKNIGQAETMKKKRKRMVEFSKAGIEVLQSEQPFEKMDNDDVSTESESELDESHYSSHYLIENDRLQPIVAERGFSDNATLPLCSSRPSINENENVLADEPATDDCAKKTNLTERSIEIPKAVLSYSRPTVVHVSRPDEVEKTRKDLPIVMMEQEIMEAINYNLSVIICGETGCGKTTQVPQFLYEAGYGSRQNVARGGIIGVTQPRRVAVLATARRVAYELGLSLGKEVGFQVRYDKKIGHNSSIKFMTDGILLRELQNDFLLRRFSVIILDEAHERSLNTDILIGMLSRTIQSREIYYSQQQKSILSGQTISPENQVFPLKLVLMSATLRVEDFLSGKRLFCNPPPVLEVPTRQYPVTVHFSKRTEIVDYIGQAYKKVLAIHKRLPQGGILVFVTGQREVEYLCQKLRRASKELVMKASKEKGETDQAVAEPKSIQGISMEEINEAFDTRGQLAQQQTDMFGSNDDDEEYNVDDEELDSYDSDTDSDLEYTDDNTNSSQEETSEVGGSLLDVLGDDGNLDALKAAFVALASQTASASSSDGIKTGPVTGEARLDQSNPGTAKRSGGGNDSSPGALRVLPLYAMLPAAAQLRVFEEVKEGERLVVVATNVAETSLTIPGIKYVVDTGREKVKNYNSANGMESYDIQWISKASAAQRAGRAGRTGPGHCYRLYSSAVFNNIFPDFALAEILKVPVDGVVLLLKSMCIDKVVNFPFPTPPKASALVEAERCLKALEALDSDGKLTALGKAMARYPMSPRHSRMLLTVIQIVRKKKSDARPNLVLAYAVAAAAALSLSNPFVRQFEDSQASRDEEQHEGGDAMERNEFLDKEEKSRRKKLKETAKASRQRFSNPSSDALSTAYALQCFEIAKSPTEFCNENYLHLKTMEEMTKLRKQLLQLVFSHGSDWDLEQDLSWTFGTLDDVEQSWNVLYDKHPLSLYEEGLLGQSICAGWADRVARRIRRNSKSLADDGNVRSVRYQACSVKETVFLHRWSSVSNSAPEFLVYSELLQTNRPYMHGVTRIKSEWLVEYARPLCTFSAPSTDTKPYYEPRTDQVMHYMVPNFGPHLWELPPHSLAITDTDHRIEVFGYSLLEGQVLPCLKSVREYMAAPPASILRREASGQRRVGNLISKLRGKSIVNRAKLSEAWSENPRELYSEIKDWFQEGFVNKFEVLWSQMLCEAVLDVQKRFPKKSNKRVSTRKNKLKRVKL